MKLTAKAVLDAEQKEIQERQRRFTGLTPKDTDFHSSLMIDCMMEDCIDHSGTECEQALIDTWQPNTSFQDWFIAAKRYLKNKGTTDEVQHK
jgi:hypothetical protein